MDRWTQTPNLVFKPTSIVAFARLAIQQREVIDWGLYRKPESRIGGYYPVINNMLTDGGPWHEAPTYPFTHTDIYCMGMVSRYRALYDGKDWWTAKAPSGGSPKGLMDYYIDTAYPIVGSGARLQFVLVASREVSKRLCRKRVGRPRPGSFNAVKNVRGHIDREHLRARR